MKTSLLLLAGGSLAIAGAAFAALYWIHRTFGPRPAVRVR